MATQNNGTSKLLWWTLTAAFGIAISLAGAWAADVNHRVNTNCQKTSQICERLSSIETKLDLLLQR